MTNPSTPRRRWRRTALATAGVSLIAAVAPMISASPAAAVNAPLTTTDGIGIRLDENAIFGPALELIEDELQPFVNTKIYQGALNNSVMDNPDWVTGTATIELSFDFVNAGVTGYPSGGLKVHGDLTNILMRFYRYGAWWQPQCLIHVVPDNGYIDASAKVNSALLPSAPLQLNPITAYWDTTPTATVASGYSTLCYGYLIDEWWDGLWGTGADVATQLEDELNAQAQDLVNDLWTDNVTPVVNSLNEFGITFNQIRTDDEGLIVTANLAVPTTGLVIPGSTTGFNVTNTPDAGVTSNINTLLAQNTREVIATIHPNVASQFLNALNQRLTTEWGFYSLSSTIKTVLIPTTLWGLYDDNEWYLRFTAPTAPNVTPTGTGGAPEVNLPSIQMEIWNVVRDENGPIATFTGNMYDLNLVTQTTGTTWGPRIISTNAILAGVTRTQTNGEALNPTATQLQPFARTAWTLGATDLFTGFVNLPALTIGGLAITLCTTCTRFTGDQRYTEYFNVA